MSDPTPDATAPTAKPAETAVPSPADQAAEEWKPEPRQWTWKDLFTAPMLAFKPKCILIMAVTVLVIGLWYKFAPGPHVFGAKTPAFIDGTIGYLWHTVALVVFSLAATLVATFMKADLLDDEFLTFSEAIAQWRGRILSAILVPVFLAGIYGGFIALLALAMLVGSIPLVGPTLYALLYPLGILLALFIVLLSIAVTLAVFVFPAIIAIRKHGWFDNVVDTFEAVGTKPHVLVGSGILTFALLYVAAGISFGAMGKLKGTTTYLPGDALVQTERQADQIRTKALNWVNPVLGISSSFESLLSTSAGGNSGGAAYAYDAETGQIVDRGAVEGYNKVTGTITGIWKIIFSAIFLGYLANLFIGGGMLTYLAVREDDYWDDEDLEDLDKLAKELEDEAKAEAAKGDPAKADAAKPAAGEPAKPAMPVSPAAETVAVEKPPEPPKA